MFYGDAHTGHSPFRPRNAARLCEHPEVRGRSGSAAPETPPAARALRQPTPWRPASRCPSRSVVFSRVSSRREGTLEWSGGDDKAPSGTTPRGEEGGGRRDGGGTGEGALPQRHALGRCQAVAVPANCPFDRWVASPHEEIASCVYLLAHWRPVALLQVHVFCQISSDFFFSALHLPFWDPDDTNIRPFIISPLVYETVLVVFITF